MGMFREILSYLANKLVTRQQYSKRDKDIILACAEKIAQVVKESLQIAATTNNPETKVSRLQIAHQQIDELKKYVERYPFLQLTNIEAAELAVRKLESGEEVQIVGAIFPSENDDLIKGYRFCATMSLETPLSVLEKDGDVIHGQPIMLPKYSDERFGIWMLELKSWEELAREAGGNAKLAKRLDELRPKEIQASDVGPIPLGGGEYLEFLKEFRRIVESEETIDSKLEKLNALSLQNDAYSSFAKKHGGLGFGKIWFSSVFREIPGVGNKATTLFEAGYRTLDDLAAASNEELQQFQGIGPATVAKIREYLSKQHKIRG